MRNHHTRRHTGTLCFKIISYLLYPLRLHNFFRYCCCRRHRPRFVDDEYDVGKNSSHTQIVPQKRSLILSAVPSLTHIFRTYCLQFNPFCMCVCVELCYVGCVRVSLSSSSVNNKSLCMFMCCQSSWTVPLELAHFSLVHTFIFVPFFVYFPPGCIRWHVYEYMCFCVSLFNRQ